PAGTTGYLLAGPYMPLAAGRYDVTFALRRDGAALAPNTIVAVVEALADGAEPCLARREVRARDLDADRWTPFEIGFDVPSLRWVGQLCVHTTGVDALAVDTAVVLDDHTTGVWPPLARPGSIAAS